MKTSRMLHFGLLAAVCAAGAIPPLLAQGPQSFGPERPPMERSAGPRGDHFAWWRNPEIAKKIGLSDDQVKKMDEIFQQNRLALIDIEATLQKEEMKLKPLIDADTPDEAAVLAQVDRVAQARAELEKTNARFLLGIRKQLTPEQWKKLKADMESHHHSMHGPMPHGGGMPGTPEGEHGDGGPQGAQLAPPPSGADQPADPM